LANGDELQRSKEKFQENAKEVEKRMEEAGKSVFSNLVKRLIPYQGP